MDEDYIDIQGHDARLCSHCVRPILHKQVFVYLISNLGCNSHACAELGHPPGICPQFKETDQKEILRRAAASSNHIGVSPNPEDRTRDHNRLVSTHCDDKSTNKSKPRWVLEMKLGPMDRKTALAASKEWKKQYRTLYSRIRGGIDIAREFKINSAPVRNFDAWNNDNEEGIPNSTNEEEPGEEEEEKTD